MTTHISRATPRRGRVAVSIVALTLGVAVLSACGGGESPTSAPPGEGGIPQQLVGTWRDAAASGGQYCDPGGHCTGDYGGSESYTFSADGHFVFSQYLEGSLYECRIVTTLYVTGTAAVSGSSITLSTTSARQTKQANCEDSFDRSIDIDPTTYTWRIGTSAEGVSQLYMENAAGASGPYDLTP